MTGKRYSLIMVLGPFHTSYFHDHHHIQLLRMEPAMFTIKKHTIFSVKELDKYILIISIKLAIITTFLHINKKRFIVQKQKSDFWKARVMDFTKSTIAFILIKNFSF